MSDWLWFGARLSRYRDRENRTPASDEGAPLCVGLARARFGLGVAPSGVAASWEKGFDGKNLSPRKGGTRLHVANKMARKATQELGCWKAPVVIQGVYTKARSEEVAPGMRSAVTKACAAS